MKTKAIITTLLVLCFTVPTQAQFFKKLKQKAEEAAERTILNRTDKEVSKGTDKTIDGITGTGKKKDTTIGETETNNSKELTDEEKQAAESKITRMFGGGLEGVPDSYPFSYVLTYQMKSGKETFPFEYFLEPGGAYFANKMADPETNSIVVYDLKKNIMVTFMDNGQQKMAMKMKMPNMKKVQQKHGDKLFPDEGDDDVKITPIESKTIHGYRCLGFKMVSKEGVGKVWITNAAPVSLNGVFANFKKLPNTGPYANMPLNETSLIMEMEFQSNKKKKDNMHMVCTQLKEQAFTIQKKEYQSGM